MLPASGLDCSLAGLCEGMVDEMGMPGALRRADGIYFCGETG
jgi:hypothetical protein